MEVPKRADRLRALLKQAFIVEPRADVVDGMVEWLLGHAGFLAKSRADAERAKQAEAAKLGGAYVRRVERLRDALKSVKEAFSGLRLNDDDRLGDLWDIRNDAMNWVIWNDSFVKGAAHVHLFTPDEQRVLGKWVRQNPGPLPLRAPNGDSLFLPADESRAFEVLEQLLLKADAALFANFHGHRGRSPGTSGRARNATATLLSVLKALDSRKPPELPLFCFRRCSDPTFGVRKRSVRPLLRVLLAEAGVKVPGDLDRTLKSLSGMMSTSTGEPVARPVYEMVAKRKTGSRAAKG